EFLDRVESLIGVRPEVLAGSEEAELSFRGATAALPGDGPTLVIDPGGGSTEFVWGVDRVEYSRSVDIGSVRLRDRMPPGNPARAGAVASGRDEARRVMAEVRLPGQPQRIIGVAGTFTSLAAIHLELAVYDRERTHGTVMHLSDLDALVDHLARLSLTEIAAIPSMDPKRAPVMLAGAIVAAEAVRLAGDQVIVSEYDMLDALI
ncbi:MAG TPA: hypothetical protein VFY15_00370, partial [Acidimicrobiia bacterium]|nr:hypothetical protein [Acidimicrobiia bacterium]